VDIVENVGKHFNIHPLTLEDIVNTAQRPKVEDFENYIFVVLKMLSCDEDAAHISSGQVRFDMTGGELNTYRLSFRCIAQPLNLFLQIFPGFDIIKMGGADNVCAFFESSDCRNFLGDFVAR